MRWVAAVATKLNHTSSSGVPSQFAPCARPDAVAPVTASGVTALHSRSGSTVGA